MVFCIDYRDGDVLEWTTTEAGAAYTRRPDYHPRIYVSGDQTGLETLADDVGRSPAVVETEFVEQRVGFRHDPERVLALAIDTIDDVRSIAASIRDRGTPGEFRLYNVDLSREFRYCLEEDVDPTPERALRTLSVRVPERALGDGDFETLSLNGTRETGHPTALLDRLSRLLDEQDPDVLRVNTAQVVPFLYDQAAAHGVEFDLGRRPGYEQLAGESTYESYGRVGHSPARYNVPGRVVVDESNTFFYDEANLAGCLDLVARSYKPLQELSWASIGNVLTAIQIREARSRDVLVPWNSWRHEFFKPMRTLHDADRGGFTFSPETGIHEDVHELDFSSLYPNIICTRNISPETIRCDCHSHREDVPGLGYSICDDPGYLPDVLQPLIDDRDEFKGELAETEDRASELQGKSGAIKWILVSCFGYQGFSNAKFGRIECHEAINAFAREILLDAKQRLEDHGWHVVHGIVDSIWVTRNREDATPIEDVAAEISEASEIRFEHDGAYDWVAFVPQRDTEAGALTKYFGERRDGTFKYRGIECRQRSTCEFVETAQRELVRRLGDTRNPEELVATLRTYLEELERGTVTSEEVAITNRVSKDVDEYSQYTRNVAALQRADDVGVSRAPGQSVQYVVVDDSKRSRDRVALLSEDPSRYDTEFYRTRLIRAAASVLSPLDVGEPELRRYLDSQKNGTLEGFG